MNYKIQSKTILGWMDITGDFDTIQDAQEEIPKLQDKLFSVGSYHQITSILRIVDVEELSVNDFYLYDKNEPIDF